MNIPTDLKYVETHEWVKPDNSLYLCGITDYAQSELSDVVFVELPEVGKIVKKGETLCIVESVKAASDIYAPISGEVVSVNEVLTNSPEKVNSDPFGDGWFCRIKPTNESELDELMSAEQYQTQLQG